MISHPAEAATRENGCENLIDELADLTRKTVFESSDVADHIHDEAARRLAQKVIARLSTHQQQGAERDIKVICDIFGYSPEVLGVEDRERLEIILSRAPQPDTVTEEMVKYGASAIRRLFFEREEFEPMPSYEDIAKSVIAAALNPIGGK